MATYPIDIEPEQTVRWLIAEQTATPSLFRLELRFRSSEARRVVELHDISAHAEYHLGDEEREDLSEVETIATLEATPAHASDGWSLKVVVEDEAGPRVAAAETGGVPEQQIDLGTFYHQFIGSGRGIATVTAEALDIAGARHLNQLVDREERRFRVGTR